MVKKSKLLLLCNQKIFCQLQLIIVSMLTRLRRNDVSLVLCLDVTEIDWLAGEWRGRGELPGRRGEGGESVKRK